MGSSICWNVLGGALESLRGLQIWLGGPKNMMGRPEMGLGYIIYIRMAGDEAMRV